MRRLFLPFALTWAACGGTPAAKDASPDVTGVDAPADTNGGSDARADTTGSCDPAAVAFPQGGMLQPGTLCDEVYACADDAAGAARIEAASPRFSCAPGSEPQSTCTAYTCSYRDPAGPSTLDAGEIAEICAVTLLSPAPRLTCVVFVNAP